MTTTLASFQEEWQNIQCDTNLPRRIERHHHFGERFRAEHEVQKERCTALEGKLASLLHQKESARDAPCAQRETASDDKEETVAELWTLLQALQKTITETAQRSAKDDANVRYGAERSRPSGGGTREPDPLQLAFDALERFSRVRDKLHALLDAPLDADIVHQEPSPASPHQEPSPASPHQEPSPASPDEDGTSGGGAAVQKHSDKKEGDSSDVATTRRSQRRRKKCRS